MARVVRSAPGYSEPTPVYWRVVENQTIFEGDIVQYASASKYLLPAITSADTLVGIAAQSITTGPNVTENDKILVTPIMGQVIRMDFRGTLKPNLTDEDLFTLFSFSALAQSPGGRSGYVLDLDSTGGKICAVVAYNNTEKWADVIILDSKIHRIA